MKLNCQRGPLVTAFSIVNAVVPTRTPKPILQNAKLRSQGGETVLIGTDGDIGMRFVVPNVTASRDGEVLLPTRRIIEILRELRDDAIELDVGADTLKIKTARSEFNLPIEDPAEFPDVRPFGEKQYVEVDPQAFRSMIKRTIFATDVESTRYALGGILLDLKPNHLGLVATDTRRLALAHGPCTLTGEGFATNPIVPTKAMSLVERSIGDTVAPVRIACHAHEILFEIDAATISSRLVEGRFPKYADVIPKKSDISIDLVVGPFHSVVRQALIVTNDESRGVDFHFHNGVLTLKSQAADIGQSRVELPISYDGPELLIRFDPRFIADFLKVLETEQTITLGMNDADSAAVLKTEDGYTYVIMPLERDGGRK